jgi:hypothetical protein
MRKLFIHLILAYMSRKQHGKRHRHAGYQQESLDVLQWDQRRTDTTGGKDKENAPEYQTPKQHRIDHSMTARSPVRSPGHLLPLPRPVYNTSTNQYGQGSVAGIQLRYATENGPAVFPGPLPPLVEASANAHGGQELEMAISLLNLGGW